MTGWTLAQLEEQAVWLVQGGVAPVGHRFAALVVAEDLRWFHPEQGEDYLTFADRALVRCGELNGGGVIVGWQWPERSYVSVTLACPEGVRSIGIEPKPVELN